MTKEYIKSLDAIRGIAALLVCLYHACVLFNSNGYNFVPHAYLAVDLFFVLSGFILVYRYEPMINNPKPINFRNFAVLRFARLYPLFLAATFAGAAYTLLRLYANGQLGQDLKIWLQALGLNSILLPFFNGYNLSANDGVFPFAVQSWSILWEFIVSALFFAWAKVKNNSKFLIPIPLFLVLVAATSGNEHIDGGWQTSDFWIGGARAFAGFSVGIVTATIYQTRLINISHKSQILLKSFALIIGISAIIYICLNGATTRFYELGLVGIGFPIIILGACFSKGILFNNPISNALGMASYSIYLTHPLLIDVTNSIIQRIGINPSIMLGIIWTSLVIVISLIVYKFFEMPARKYFKKALWGK